MSPCTFRLRGDKEQRREKKEQRREEEEEEEEEKNVEEEEEEGTSDLLLLPKPKVDLLAPSLLTSALDVSSSDGRTTEVDADGCLKRALEAGHVSVVEDTVAHGDEEAIEVWTTKVGTAVEFGEGILCRADAVEHDVLRRVHVELLREVSVDA